MHYLALAQEAQLHREAYIATLNGLLQTPAAKQQLAQTVGITPQYLSNLLNPFDRTPSPALATKIVDALPLDRAARDNLLEHLLLSSEQRLQVQWMLQREFSQVDVATQLDLIHRAHSAANFVTDPQQANARQQTVHTAGTLLLQQIQPMVQPLDYAQLCLWLHGVESSRNLHTNAIYHAKKARAVLSHFARTEFGPDNRERFDEFTFTALRLEAVTYTNLKVARSAYELCCAGEVLPEVTYRPAAWLPHLYRDKINAYSALPRFSIRAAERWAHHGKQLCEGVAHDQAPLWAFMLDRSMAQAYLRYGSVKKAMKLLKPLVEELEKLPVAGLLHRVSFLKTYAEALAMEGDQQTWTAVIASALELAEGAGLTHQIAEIKEQYGANRKANTLNGA